MPIPLTTGTALIGAGTQALNIAGSLAQNYYNRKYAEDQYRKQRTDNLADRDYANNYNSPISQMQRYKDAGLNPNLMYGGGATSQQAAVQTQQADTKNLQPQAPQLDGASILQMFYNLQSTIAKTDNVRANTEQQQLGARLSEQSLEQKGKLFPGQLEAQTLDNRNKLLQGNNQFTQNEIQQALKENTIQQQFQKLVNMKQQELLSTQQLENNPKKMELIQTQIRSLENAMDNANITRQLREKELEMLNDGYTKNDPLWARQLILLVTSLMGGNTTPLQEKAKEGAKTVGQKWIDHVTLKDARDKYGYLLKSQQRPQRGSALRTKQ